MSSSPFDDAELKAELDTLQTPPEHARGQRGTRRFGASRFRHADARALAGDSSRRDGRDAPSNSSSSATPAFASGSDKAHGRQFGWDEDDRFNFGSDDRGMCRRPEQHEHEREQQCNAHRREHDSGSYDHHRNQQQHQPGHLALSPKYAKLRASGKPVTPGASLNYSSDTHLKNAYLPPKETSSFIASIMNVSSKAAASKPAAASPKRLPLRMKATTGGLEFSSAPVPSRVAASTSTSSRTTAAHAPTLGWQSRKERVTETPVRSQKARIALGPGPREPTRTSPRHHPPSSFAKTRESTMLPKRNRDVQLSYETSKSIAQSVMRRTTRAAKVPTDGTADQPIDLDTDSDHDASPPPPKRVAHTPAPLSVPSQTTRPAKSSAARLKPAHWKDVDMDAIARDPVAELSAMVVWLGRLRCCADVYLRQDCLWIASIRSTLVKWDRMPHLKLSIKDCKSVHVYKYTDDKAPIADSGLQPDERLMAKTSFAALNAPCAYDADADALRAFYDPLGDDAAKKFIVIEAPEYDCHGIGFDPLTDFFKDNRPELLQMIPDVLAGKQFLQALVRAPYNDDSDNDDSGSKSEGTAAAADAAESTRRTRRNRDAKHREPGESEEDDSDCFDVQLTYPLPPCSSDIVTITRHDVSCLRPEQYLNDNIIDYYFKRLMLEDYADDTFMQRNVLFLSSHFYSRLRVGKGTSVAERLRAGYRNVATWVTRSDFFSRHLIFIPINKDMHWSLAVIVNPRSASVESPSEDQPPSCIAVLDPLGSYHNKQAILRNLRSFLQLEWESTHSNSAAAAAAADVSTSQDAAASPSASAKRRRRPRPNLNYDPERVTFVRVKTPQQQNSYDCGVYVLKFAEKILESYGAVSRMFDDSGPISKDVVDDKLESLIPPTCISPGDITETRARIQKAILHDTHKYRQVLADVQDKSKQSSAETGGDASKEQDATSARDTARVKGAGDVGEVAGDSQTSVRADESVTEKQDGTVEELEIEDDDVREVPEPMDQDNA